MKRVVLFFFCFLFLCIQNIEAKKGLLEEEYLKGVYFIQEDESGFYHSHQQAIFRVDGKIAYCLDPELAAKTGLYQIVNGLDSSFSELEKQKIEEFGYYGYEYPNHQTVNYYLATQELIWEFVSNYEVSWNTKLNGKGEKIDIEKEKKKILELIEENKKNPSFSNQKISLYKGESFILKDYNNTLERFEIDSDFAEIKDNQLIISPLTSSITIKGKRKPYDLETTLIYFQDDSQRLATLRLSNPVTFSLDIELVGTKLQIQKLGEIRNGITFIDEWESLSNIVFEIYANEDIKNHSGEIIYKKDELIDVIVTKNGIAYTNHLLLSGSYKLVEINDNTKYKNIKPIFFEINTSVENEKVILVKNYLSTGNVEIIKKDQSGKLLEGVKFALYDENGKKLDEKITDSNGKIIWSDIPIGNYQLQELETQKGYILDSKKVNIKVTETIPLYLERINLLELPNTSSKQEKNQILLGMIGIFISGILLKR